MVGRFRKKFFWERMWERETGRSLAGPAREQTFIPLDRFQLAGWSKDADGRLDPRRIQDIRIGWGGYLGTVGETVEFSVGLPQLGRAARPEIAPYPQPRDAPAAAPHR